MAIRPRLAEGGNAAGLNLRLEALLAAHEEPESLAGPDKRLQFDDAPTPAEQAGSQVGRYRLLEKLGVGGFGEVWAAEQKEPVRRRVALKIIKLGMDTRQVVSRFEAERQALAMMDHPNIARVLDAGATDTGRPYFVMDLVEGISITEFCEHGKLDIASRLDLFIKVCQAIQHAHQKGIIQREWLDDSLGLLLPGLGPTRKGRDLGSPGRGPAPPHARHEPSSDHVLRLRSGRPTQQPGRNRSRRSSSICAGGWACS